MHPSRYHLELELAVSGPEFSGTVQFEIDSSSPELLLNAQELRIDRVAVDGRPAGFSLDAAKEELRVATGGVGRHRVEIAYRGTILEPGLTGLYRSTFAGGSILTTMMYPTGARRVLPCVDEPAAKAVFEVTVTAPAGPLVIFNTPAEATERVGDRQRVRFAPTPKMSTYLLYLAVGKFAEISAHSGATEVRVALPPGREPAGEFALAHACRVLAALNDYYGIPYELPKLHLVSVPAFWAGAMENWGAIAFRETQLLVDGTTGTLARRLVRETVSHEIAHQWFGNLVTNRWWNDFWLNEAFATWMEGTIDSQLYPELQVWSDFQIRFCGWGLDGDAFSTTHPIRVAVEHPNELAQVADEVTYGKGAMVIRMIAAYVGDDAFRSGINRYLRRHAHDNASADDLWAALEESAGRPVRRIMGEWTERPGYPIVRASVANGSLRLRQERFRYFAGPPEAPWPLPLTVRIAGEDRSLLLEESEVTIPCPAGALVLINPDRTGFYRVEYDAPLAARLSEAYASLSELDRWGLLFDRGGLMYEGSASPADLAAELERAASVPGYLLAEEAFALQLSTEGFFREEPHLRTALGSFFGRSLDAIGVDPRPGEGELMGRLRARLLLGRVRADPEFSSRLAERFSEFDRLSPDLRGPVALAYGFAADARAVPALEARMAAASSEEEATQIGRALAAIRDPAAIDRVLDRLFLPEIPANRACTILVELSRNPAAIPRLRSWMPKGLSELERVLTGTPLLGQVLLQFIPAVGYGAQEEMVKFLSARTFPEANRAVAKSLEWLEVLERLRRRLPG